MMALGLYKAHQNLINEADALKKARPLEWGKELVDLTPSTSNQTDGEDQLGGSVGGLIPLLGLPHDVSCFVSNRDRFNPGPICALMLGHRMAHQSRCGENIHISAELPPKPTSPSMPQGVILAQRDALLSLPREQPRGSCILLSTSFLRSRCFSFLRSATPPTPLGKVEWSSPS